MNPSLAQAPFRSRSVWNHPAVQTFSQDVRQALKRQADLRLKLLDVQEALNDVQKKAVALLRREGRPLRATASLLGITAPRVQQIERASEVASPHR